MADSSQVEDVAGPDEESFGEEGGNPETVNKGIEEQCAIVRTQQM